jgi:hypothetical protein
MLFGASFFLFERLFIEVSLRVLDQVSCLDFITAALGMTSSGRPERPS